MIRADGAHGGVQWHTPSLLAPPKRRVLQQDGPDEES